MTVLVSGAQPLVIVHGGAGEVSEAKRSAHVEGCRRAAEAGLLAIERGDDALEAVLAAVEVLEDDPLFNAGTGASLTCEGSIELDASVMEGRSLRAGAVAVLPPFTHPVRIARAVLEEGRHVLLAGAGAARFAHESGFVPATLEAMRTEAAIERLARWHRGQAGEGWAGGTVGAVARDALGRIAAATSTGGTVGKRPGRVGDTPIIGAGTYADDEAGGCSTTGIGEAILRASLARSAVELVRAGVPAPEAARAAVATFGRRVGGKGGLVLIDRHGDAAFAWNTSTMSHAIARSGQPTVGGC